MNGRNTVVPYPSKETKEFKKKFIPYVQDQVKNQGWEMDGAGLQHYYMYWTIYFPRVDMDSANLDKVIADSITESKCVWIDDNTLLNRVDRVYYDSKNPHVELRIVPVDYIGIFDNKEELEKFESKCKTCSRYNRNCSILNKAKSGRVQEEISDCVCNKYKEKQGE